MSNLNVDILYLIFKELEDDGNSLLSCLLVNKNWLNIIIPILWKNPWKYLKEKINSKMILLKVIISHSSDESRKNLENLLYFDFITYQKPFFKYISFCNHADFHTIIDMITSIFSSYATNIIVNEIINLFINENMKFTHLYIPTEFNYKIHLISGFEHCFSELEFLRCDLDNNNQNILKELARICKSIKNLGFRPSDSNIEINSIIKLIESQKELNSLCYLAYKVNESFRTSLEKSLIKHVNTLQYLEINDIPITKFLSYLNLISIELDGSGRATCWKNLEDVTLPHLKFLKAKYIPYEYLAKLIENTKGTLNEISIYSLRLNESNNERLIEAIARNCLNLKYLTLVLRNRDITGLEKLLINCQYLNGLVIIPSLEESLFFWIKVFGMLIQFSPIGLFKFKFYVLHINSFSQLQFLNLFFDKWKGRHPMLFQTVQMHINHSKLLEKVFKKIKKYKAEGIVKTYENDLHGNNYEEFEWIKKRI